MDQSGEVSEKSMEDVVADSSDDVRTFVRLLQCPQCSRPFRNPVTLPCGNTLCRACLPVAHQRENISYPDLPGRRQGISCPFGQLEEHTGPSEHPSSDCSVNVILAKVMESVAEAITRHASLASEGSLVQPSSSPHDSLIPEAMTEKPTSLRPTSDRLVAMYSLAAQGKLDYKSNSDAEDGSGSAEFPILTNNTAFQDIIASTAGEVDCQVCYNVMLDPVTTYCGHTLCRRCMARVLDHSLHCPVCRRGLAIPPLLSTHPSSKTLVSLLGKLYPELVAARAEAVAAEEAGNSGDLNVPLFVCTLGFPGQPTLLRIFEPRYRLMLRRCMEGNREFGILMYNRYGEPQGDLGPVHFYHYGTMLRIIHTQLLPDGTSLVELRGAYRFRVKAHGVLDGYCVGTVERVEDVPLDEEERVEAAETSASPPADGDVSNNIDRMSTRQLLTVGQEFVAKMRNRSANWLQQRVLDIHGEPPNDPAIFPYWFASVLPINDDEKYKLLETRTVRERMKITTTWIRRIEAQRWAAPSPPLPSESDDEEEEGEEQDGEETTTTTTTTTTEQEESG